MSRSLLSAKNILLLGASGQLGHEIRKAFAAVAPDCTLYCCSRSPFAGVAFPNEVWLQLDPLSGDWAVPGNVDVVVNAVGAIRATKAMPFELVHGGVTKAILQHRAALGNPRIVQISALGAALDQASEFLRTKAEADEMLLQVADAVVLRPSIVCTTGTMLAQKMGTLLSIAKFALGKMLVPTGFPLTQIQPILGSDVGMAVVCAALRDAMTGVGTELGNTLTGMGTKLEGAMTGVVDLVGPEQISFGELVAVMAHAQGRQIRLVEVSREIMETFVANFMDVFFPNVINLDQFRLLFQDNVGDVRATAALLGKMPASTLDFWRAEATGSHEPIAVECEGSTDRSFLKSLST